MRNYKFFETIRLPADVSDDDATYNPFLLGTGCLVCPYCGTDKVSMEKVQLTPNVQIVGNVELTDADSVVMNMRCRNGHNFHLIMRPDNDGFTLDCEEDA
jgi:hypothetical protein